MSLLSLRKISKEFPGVKALDEVNLNLYEGEAMALLGENGAGKSTLIKVLAGIYKKDSGEILYNGENIEINSIHDSQHYNISVIHQELNLIPNLSVAENIFIGREEKKFLGMIDKELMNRKAKECLDELGISISPKTKVSSLSIASQQMVEIAKALSYDAKIIIMDEPTDALTDKEVDTLFKVIKRLKQQKKSIVYISHRLPEIFEICEKVTILRDGKFIAEKAIEELDENLMIEMMVGRSLNEQFPYIPPQSDETIMEVHNLSNEFVEDISFRLCKGEILGIAGLVGASRTELAKTLYGTHSFSKGRILIHSESFESKKDSAELKKKVAYVSEDRKKDGLVLSMNVRENISLSSLDQISSPIGVNRRQEEEVANFYKDKMNIRTPSLEQKIKNLSGGNQQKVSISRALMTKPEILILDEPTRGVDVGAKHEIYQLINELKKEKKGIIVISSEMPELLGISDRILVMHEGRKKGELLRAEFSQEKIMHCILS